MFSTDQYNALKNYLPKSNKKEEIEDILSNPLMEDSTK